jgi:hypothetical protein
MAGDPQRQRALPRPQCPHGPVQRDRRRRTRRVDGDRGSVQPERVGDTAGNDTGQAAGPTARRVVVVCDPREHAGIASAERCRIDSRTLERLPGGLQQQPLLWVGPPGLSRGDAEELGVEFPGVVQESPSRVCRFCRACRVPGRTALRHPSCGSSGRRKQRPHRRRPVPTTAPGGLHRRESGSSSPRLRSARAAWPQPPAGDAWSAGDRPWRAQDTRGASGHSPWKRASGTLSARFSGTSTRFTSTGLSATNPSACTVRPM